MFRSLFPLFSCLAAVSCAQPAVEPRLLPAPMENGRYGYVDRTGVEMILATYRAAGFFAEGLAAVRYQGTYGYIDRGGHWVVENQFDYATAFQGARALVYLNGKPYMIDRTGRILFEHAHAELWPLPDASTIVVADTVGDDLWYGLVDAKGRELLPCLYERLRFEDGLAVACTATKDRKDPRSCGVVDSLGHWVVPLGSYQRIQPFSDGMALVELLPVNKNEDQCGAIDRTGKLRVAEPAGHWWSVYSSSFSNGYCAIRNYRVDPASIKIWGANDHYTHAALIDEDGRMTASDTSWENITDVDHDRAFAQLHNRRWILITPQGRRVGDAYYDNVSEGEFDNGLAVVLRNGDWLAIDTSGAVVHTLSAAADFPDEVRREGDLVVCASDVSREKDEDMYYRYDLWDLQSGAFTRTGFKSFHALPEVPGVYYAELKDQHGYVDRKGKFLWKGRTSGAKDGVLNIDHMNRGYCYASSRGPEDLDGAGGWSDSANRSRKVASRKGASGGGIELVADTDDREQWAKAYEGLRVRLRNAGTDTLYFPAQDSRLYMNMQALDATGAWKDIEYLPSSWCGNSYHTLFLASGEEWNFVAPRYEGERPTQLRIKVGYRTSHDYKVPMSYAYSASFAGSVNPGQFWRKPGHSPNGLMDPYNE